MGTDKLTIANGIALNDGKKIPRIGFGTYLLEAGDAAYQAVTTALEAGYRHIDAARLYCNERSVGRAIAESGIARSELFITSKVWNDRLLAGSDAIRASVEQTLTALQLDHLNLLLIHWPVADCYRGAWEVFQELQAEGLVTSIGVSNFTVGHLEDLLSDGSPVPVVNQMEHHPYMQDKPVLEFCRQNNIVYEAWAPLGRGKPLSDPVLVEIAKAHDADVAQVIVAWMCQTGIVPLPRSSKPERIRSNAKALDITLSADEVGAIEALNTGAYLVPDCTPYGFDELNEIISPTD